MDPNLGLPHWSRAAGELGLYPPLSGDASCEVAIIGGGIAGALLAWQLSAAGFDVLLLDRRDVGSGSTAANTGLLQYELDTHLVDLIRLHGAPTAQLVYRSCAHAIDSLQALDRTLGQPGGGEPRHSLYCASRRWHAVALRREAQARRGIGLQVEILDRAALRERFGLSAQLAVLSRPAAQIDPYRLVHALLAACRQRGVRIYDRTMVVAPPEPRSDGQWTLRTDRDGRVLARQVVLAAGFESRDLLPGLPPCTVRSSYAFISEPLALPEVYTRTMFWETARPYLYFRAVGADRLMVGGADDPLDTANRRDRRLPAKARVLVKRMQQLLPRLELELGSAWAGTFAESHDGLPFIGPLADSPGLYVVMALGGNGLVFSVLAAELLLAWLRGQPHPLAHGFRLVRP